MSTQYKTGLSFDQDGAEAGRRAAQAALKQVTSADKPGLCLIFGSPDYDLTDVLEGVRSVIPPAAQVIGGSSEFRRTEDGLVGRALSVSLVATDEYQFLVKSSAWVKQEIPGAFNLLKAAYRDFLGKPGIGSFLMVMDESTDARGIGVAALQHFKSDMHFAGGEGNLFAKGTGVIANDMVLSNAVGICAVKGPQPFFSSVVRGHKAIRGPLSSPKMENDTLQASGARLTWAIQAGKDFTRKGLVAI